MVKLLSAVYISMVMIVSTRGPLVKTQKSDEVQKQWFGSNEYAWVPQGMLPADLNTRQKDEQQFYPQKGAGSPDAKLSYGTKNPRISRLINLVNKLDHPIFGRQKGIPLKEVVRNLRRQRKPTPMTYRETYNLKQSYSAYSHMDVYREYVFQRLMKSNWNGSTVRDEVRHTTTTTTTISTASYWRRQD